MDFTKSVMLTSDIYVSAVEHLQEKKEESARAKEIMKLKGKKRNRASSWNAKKSGDGGKPAQLSWPKLGQGKHMSARWLRMRRHSNGRRSGG